MVTHSDGAMRLSVQSPSWCAPTARATVTREADGKRFTVWTADLVNNPEFMWVDPYRGWVVTLASTCACQQPEHALVVYDETGRVVLERLQADLVTPADQGTTDLHVVEDGEHIDADGRVLFRAGGMRPLFTEDAVWLDFRTWRRKVQLVRREVTLPRASAPPR